MAWGCPGRGTNTGINAISEAASWVTVEGLQKLSNGSAGSSQRTKAISDLAATGWYRRLVVAGSGVISGSVLGSAFFLEAILSLGGLMMSDYLNFFWSEMQNYIAKADADLTPVPGQLELHDRRRYGVLLSPCFGAFYSSQI